MLSTRRGQIDEGGGRQAGRLLSAKLVVGLTVGLVLLAIVVLMFGRVDAASEPPDPETALAVYFERYFELVNAGDEAGLREHLRTPYQPQDAADRIEKYRHLGLHDLQVRYRVWTPRLGANDDYDVTIVAKTKQGETVKLKEKVFWAGDPFAWWDSDWHLEMVSLHNLDERLVGRWQEADSDGGQVMRIEDLKINEDGWYSLRVAYRRFYSSPKRFFEGDFDRETRGAADREYTSVWHPEDAEEFDLLLYDYDSDTITISRGSTYDLHSEAIDSSGESHTLARIGP